METPDLMLDTAVLDLSAVTRRPLVFMLSSRGVVPHAQAQAHTDSHGASTNHWPWGIESSSAMGDGSGTTTAYVTTYVLPYEENMFFVGHSLDGLPEPVVRLVTDPSSGARAAALVQRHLGALWDALVAGAAGLPQGAGLIKVRTDRDHWFYAAVAESRSRDSVDIDPAVVNVVLHLAMNVLDEALGFPGNLPGILDVLPTDRVALRNEKIAELFDMAAEVIDVIRGP